MSQQVIIDAGEQQFSTRGVSTPLWVAYQIAHIVNIYIVIYSRIKITLMT